jgi:hypothetical protein
VNRLKKLLTIVVGFAMTSCELMVEIDVPSGPAQLVVNSFLYPDSSWQISVSSTSPILSSLPVFPRNVLAVLKDVQGRKIDLVQVSGNPNQPNIAAVFFKSTSRPQPGMTYRLEASADGYANASATCMVPTMIEIVNARIDSAHLSRRSPGGVGSNYYEVILPVEVTFQDPPGEKDFYTPQLIVTRKYSGVDPRTGEPVEGTYDMSVPLQRQLPKYEFSFESENNDIEDLGFDGELHTMALVAAVFVVNDPSQGIAQEIVKLSLSFSHSGEELHRYSRSIRLQRNTSGNPFAQPVQVYSNVEGGQGIFAGYSSSTWEFLK